MKLVIFDYDLTMTVKHLHNALMLAHYTTVSSGKGLILNGKPCDGSAVNDNYNKNDIKQYGVDVIRRSGLYQPDLLYKTIHDLLEAGHYVAIASFSAYPAIIEWSLEILGLTAAEVAKINIITGPPQNQKAAAGVVLKNEHIKLALAEVNSQLLDTKQLKGADVILIDDDAGNCFEAASMGCKYIVARAGSDYLKELSRTITSSGSGAGADSDSDLYDDSYSGEASSAGYNSSGDDGDIFNSRVQLPLVGDKGLESE